MPGHTARRSRVPTCRALAVGPVALGAFFLLASSTGLQTAIANGETRTLSFEHTHRDDRITVTYKRNGRYDEEGLKKLNYFLRDWRNNDETRMAPGLFDILWEIQRDVGTTEAIHIISSYRSPATNAMLRARSRGVAKHSQHMLGNAIDFKIPGVSIEDLRAAGLRLQRGGVGYYPGAFVHVDVGNVRHWPRMSEAQLARVFRDGKNRPAPVQTADASGSVGKGRNVLAKLLGIGKDEDEDEGEGTASPRGGKPAATAAPARVETAAVPLPRARPAQVGEFQVASAVSRPAKLSEPAAAPAGEFSLASAGRRPARLSDPGPVPAEFNLASTTSRPARLSEPPAATAAASSPMATPNDVINARGFWREPDDVPPATRQAIGSHGERLAWVTGPSGQQVPPRPPADVGTPAVEEPPTDTTASVAAWTSNPNQNDRVPRDVALAYAAAAAPGAIGAARPATVAPMGAIKPATPATTPSATVATRRAAVNSPAAKITPRGFDPWLRGIVMTPSVHHSLSVAVLGSVDARGLQPLMHKPRSTLPMVFSNDPTLGLVSLQFTGRAIAFLPSMDLPATRTARLN